MEQTALPANAVNYNGVAGAVSDSKKPGDYIAVECCTRESETNDQPAPPSLAGWHKTQDLSQACAQALSSLLILYKNTKESE